MSPIGSKQGNHNMAIQYRRATPADLMTVTNLLRKLYGEHHTSAELLAENRANFANPSQAFFLAYDDCAAVGIAHAAIRREYVEGSHNDVCGYLEAIYTEPEYRGRGIARELAYECEKWAARNHCTLFASDCELDNIDSLPWPGW